MVFSGMMFFLLLILIGMVGAPYSIPFLAMFIYYSLEDIVEKMKSINHNKHFVFNYKNISKFLKRFIVANILYYGMAIFCVKILGDGFELKKLELFWLYFPIIPLLYKAHSIFERSKNNTKLINKL